MLTVFFLCVCFFMARHQFRIVVGGGGGYLWVFMGVKTPSASLSLFALETDVGSYRRRHVGGF